MTAQVPAALLARGRWQQEGERGQEWIRSLPALIEIMLETWSLTPDGPARSGYEGVAMPVRRGAEACMLKISFADESNHEALALRTWNGRGAVRLIAESAADGAMLLERADDSRTLAGVDLDSALDVAGRLARTLSVPAPSGPRRTAAVFAGTRADFGQRREQLACPFPARLLGAAQQTADELAAAAPAADTDLLVNWDLHYGNVLAARREPWLVIDPKVAAGIAEYGPAQLLWTRLDEMDGPAGLRRCFRRLTDAADLDHDLAVKCAIVRCTDYWLWALSAGLTDDPVRCERIVTTFAG